MLIPYLGASEGEIIEFFINGGRVGERLGKIGGQAWFTEGEEVVVFINQATYGILATVRGGAGVIRVIHENGDELVLDHQWRPLSVFGPLDLVISPECVCRAGLDRRTCNHWETQDGADRWSEAPLPASSATELDAALLVAIETYATPIPLRLFSEAEMIERVRALED